MNPSIGHLKRPLLRKDVYAGNFPASGGTWPHIYPCAGSGWERVLSSLHESGRAVGVSRVEISFLMQSQDDATALAFVTVNRGKLLVDATAVVEFTSARQALAYTALLRTRALRTTLRRDLVTSLKGCPWVTNAEVRFTVRHAGEDWAVGVQGSSSSQFLATFATREDADSLLALLRAARAFRLWTPIGGAVSA